MRPVILAGILALAACRARTERPPFPPPPPLMSSEPGFVADCRPCRFALAPAGTTWEFTFQLDSSADGRAVKAIEARRSGASAATTLPVHGMVPIAPAEQFFFGATDLDGDGRLDLLLATARGVANTYADYWRSVGDSGFRYLGNYPLFTRDSASGRLQSYERGGDAGWVYQARQWAFRGDTLVVMREEVEEPTPVRGRYLRITRVRADSLADSLHETKRERVKDTE